MTSRLLSARSRFLTTVAGAVVATGLPRRVRAQTTALRMNIFGGVDAWPVYVIAEKGLLAGDGYHLDLTPTPGSVAQFQHMLAGDAELALTALDNVVAYDAGEGDPAVSGPFDLAAYVGIGPGFLKLVVRPEITSYAQMRGRAFAVDAPSTGFSFVLRRMLAVNGITPDSYTLTSLGNTQKRFDAIASGQCVGGVVSAPFDAIGQQQYGFRILASAVAVLGHYQATVVMARRSWVAANRPALAAYARAHRSAVAWLYDASNRAEAVAILARNTQLAPDLVGRIAPQLLTPGAYSRDGSFDRAGVQTVLALRSAYAEPKKALGPASDYVVE